MAVSRHFLIYFFLNIVLSSCVSGKIIYKRINLEKTWQKAEEYCKNDDGQLAVLNDLDRLVHHWRADNTILNITTDWIGGYLQDDGWNWLHTSNEKDKKKDKYIPVSPLIEYRGCYQPKYITGGFRMRDLTAEKCFKKCLWRGAIGLKKTICICERNLRNISVLEDDGCNERCSGNREEKCGSPLGTSVYQISRHSVLWGENEPKDLNKCAYIRKYDVTQDILWYTSSCNFHQRYLCQFHNHRACGSQEKCIRWSISSATWKGAVVECQKLHGRIAVLNVSMTHKDDDLKALPPGIYWIGLTRKQEWRWVDGSPIFDKYVTKYHGDNDNEGECVTLNRIEDSVRMARNPCDKTHSFICQYEVRDKRKVAERKVTTVIEKDVMSNTTNTKERNEKAMYKSVMYLAIGIAAGLAIVFAICIIIFMIRRCYKQSKRYNSSNGKRENFENCTVSNSSLRSTHAQRGEQGELVYDTPIDTEGESIFRRTQQMIRQGSWNPDSDGYRSNSWRRVRNGHKKEKNIVTSEIRSIYPPDNRNFRDVSYDIHKVQCHPNNYTRHEINDRNYTGSLNIKRHRNLDTRRDPEVQLADTYSLPPPSKRLSDNDFSYHVDTSDLYTCVARAMTKLHDDDEKFENVPIDDEVTYY